MSKQVGTMTNDQDEGRTPRPGAIARRAHIVGLAAVAAVVLAAVAAVLLPSLPRWAVTVSMVATGMSPLFAVPALIAGAIALSAWRLRLKATSIAAAATAVAALAAVVLPWAAAERVAAEHGVNITLSDHLSIQPQPGEPSATATYSEADGESLQADVWQPTDGTENGPALVWVHGGGWVGGARGENAPLNRYLTDRGYTVVDIDYRLSPPPSWKAQTGDVKCAVGWVRENADRLGVDAGDVSVGGASAGGNLAMLAAYTTESGGFEPSCDVDEEPVSSVVSYYGPTDTAAMMRDTGVPSMASTIAPSHFGATPGSAPARYDATSPIEHVRADLPPTLIVQGARDHIVPATQADRLSGAMKEAGAPHETVMVPWAEHGFDWAWGSWPSQVAAGATGGFLDEHTGR